MLKSEVIRRLKEGKIQIHCNVRNLPLLESILSTAYPSDVVKPCGFNYYYSHPVSDRCWASSTDRRPKTPEIELSDIVEDPKFAQGEMVEVRDNDNDKWNEREFVCEYKGQFLCTSGSHRFLVWNQIRRIVPPLHAEIEELKDKGDKLGLIVNVDVKPKE